jgi:hypothetical protein
MEGLRVAGFCEEQPLQRQVLRNQAYALIQFSILALRRAERFWTKECEIGSNEVLKWFVVSAG